MTEPLPTPATEAALYDLLRERFGIGDYDDSQGKPYYQARNAEIAKLRATMHRRRLSIEDLVVAAWYADHEGMGIVAVYQLAAIWHEAKKARAMCEREQPVLRGQLEEAAASAYEHGDIDWAERLYACDLTHAPEVLAQWNRWQSGAYS